MKKKRNRSRPPQPLQERLRQIARGAREKAAGLPPGQERDRLMETAVSNESAAAIDRWLESREIAKPQIDRPSSGGSSIGPRRRPAQLHLARSALT